MQPWTISFDRTPIVGEFVNYRTTSDGRESTGSGIYLGVARDEEDGRPYHYFVDGEINGWPQRSHGMPAADGTPTTTDLTPTRLIIGALAAAEATRIAEAAEPPPFDRSQTLSIVAHRLRKLGVDADHASTGGGCEAVEVTTLRGTDPYETPSNYYYVGVESGEAWGWDRYADGEHVESGDLHNADVLLRLNASVDDVVAAIGMLDDVRPVTLGSRWVLTSDVERGPHFIAPVGATGRVVHAEAEFVSLLLDEPLPGAEEWGNTVQWTDADAGRDGDARDALRRDAEVLA